MSLEPGARWEREIYDSIDVSCDLFLLSWSSEAKATERVRELADQGGRTDVDQ